MSALFFRDDAKNCFASTDYDSWEESDFKNHLKTRYAKNACDSKLELTGDHLHAAVHLLDNSMLLLLRDLFFLFKIIISTKLVLNCYWP